MQDTDLNYLNDSWNVYFHDPFDINWTNQSYVLISSIGDITEFWQNMFSMKDNLHKGMFFIMRDGVFPCWDDPSNINGGCLSIKILKDDVYPFWEDLCIKILGETLLKNEFRDKWNVINGISTSPKKHFCIVKIWLRDNSLADKNKFDIFQSYYGDIIYKSNIDNIHNDNS